MVRTASQLSDSEPQRILDEIQDLQRELAARRTTPRTPSGSVVKAYHELLERQFKRLDELHAAADRSINTP
jgi:hypothetical protein